MGLLASLASYVLDGVPIDLGSIVRQVSVTVWKYVQSDHRFVEKASATVHRFLPAGAGAGQSQIVVVEPHVEGGVS